MKHKNMVVGMKVLAKSHEELTDSEIKKGAEGVIVAVEPLDYTGDYVVRVDFEGGCPLWLTADAIKPAEKKEKRPLKVGDRVQEKAATTFDAGTVLTVIAVDLGDPNLTYLVGEGGTDEWRRRDDLRRVKSK